MEMVRHQRVDVHAPAELVGHLPEPLQEEETIVIIPKDVAAIDAAVVDVMKRPRKVCS
jgi:hypothetical protein